jgi:hypothetical protein
MTLDAELWSDGKMHEYEAWLWLAEAAKADALALPTGRRTGLCWQLDDLWDEGLIGATTWLRMDRKIRHEIRRLRRHLENQLFLAPCTPAGNKVRVAFCRRMAKECAK